jgi:hypothetical protein
MGPSALPPQLAAAGIGGRGSAPGTFTLCLSRAGGAMALGKPARPAGAAPLQYVFLQPSPRGFYLVGVQGFTVNGAPLTLTTVGRRATGPARGAEWQLGRRGCMAACRGAR